MTVTRNNLSLLMMSTMCSKHVVILMFFSTVHQSIELFHQPTLMHNFLYSLTICLLHYYPRHVSSINPLKPNDAYMCRTAPLTSRRFILYIYSTHISTAYFKHATNSPFFPLQNAVYFIILHCLVPVLFAFNIQGVQNFNCKI